MPAGAYYTVTGTDPDNLTIARGTSPAPQRRVMSAENLAFDREQYEQFRRETDDAQARFEARVRDLRPELGETVQSLRAEILEPVFSKWELLPGFGNQSAANASTIRANLDAQDAARRVIAQSNYQSRYQELMKQPGATPTQAAMTAALENPDLVFSGHAGSLAGHGKPTQPPAESFSTIYVNPDDPRGFKPGRGRLGSRGSYQWLDEGVPQRGTPEGAIDQTTRFQLGRLETKLKQLEEDQASDESLLSLGSKDSPRKKAMQKRVTDRQNEIDLINQQIQELLPSPSRTKSAPAAATTRKIGRYTVTVE